MLSLNPTLVTYAEHITKSWAGFLPSFGMKLAESATFLVSFHNLPQMQYIFFTEGKHFTHVELHLTNTTKMKL